MGYGPHEITTAHGSGRDVPVAPRFSVYLERRAQERVEGAAASARACDCEWDCNGDGDVFEAGAYVKAERAARGRQGAPEVETVERVRVQMTSPAGRFLDLLI